MDNISLTSPHFFPGDSTQFYLSYKGIIKFPEKDYQFGSFLSYFQLKGINPADIANIRLEFDSKAVGIKETEQESSDRTSNHVWFTIDGRKLNKKPTLKGIYIHEGRKEVLK